MSSRRSHNSAVRHAAGRTRKDTDALIKKANPSDWPFIASGTYRRELVELYKYGNYARCGKSFERVVNNELARYTEKIGLHESFGVRVIVTNMASLNKASGARPWERDYYHKKVMIAVDPSEEHWYGRLIERILSHAHPSVDRSRAVTALVRPDRKSSFSTDKIVLLGELMHPSMRGKEVYAVIREGSSHVKRDPVPTYKRKHIHHHQEGEVLALQLHIGAQLDAPNKPTMGEAAKKRVSRRDRLIRSQLHQGGRATPLTPPSQPLEGLAKDLNERIASELYGAAHATYQEALSKPGSSHKDARKKVSALIASPLFVSNAVNTAIRDDALYAKADPKTPTAAQYMAKRQLNIAELANEFVSRLQPRVAELDAKTLFRPLSKPASGTPSAGRDAFIATEPVPARSFTADVAKKAIDEVTIGHGMWDAFKDWVGYNGFNDDGDCNPGPSPDIVGFSSEPYSHTAHGVLPKVHHVPARYLIDPHGHHHRHHHHHHGRNEVKQKVIVRVHTGRREAKKSQTSTKTVTTTGADGVPKVVKEVTKAGGEGEEDASSGEDDVMLDRAQRRHKGLAYRHVNSDDDDGDSDDHHKHGDGSDEYPHVPVVVEAVPHHHHNHNKDTVLKNKTHVDAPGVAITSTTTLKELDHHRYSNFLDILRESGCLEDGVPSVYLALDNTVLTEANAKRARVGGAKLFIERYRVHSPEGVHSLAHPHFKHPTITGGALMISAAGVHYATHAVAAGAHLILDTAAVIKAAALHTVDFLTLHGLHHRHRFLPFPALHVHFPRHYHHHNNAAKAILHAPAHVAQAVANKTHAVAHAVLDPSSI
jgi:hypothetical protein